ncbi:Lovastatin diketide synthase LovF [Penicillium digitatum]|uniref:Lovastatin diketide synthase LovF n=1 Tax=Penicillium digitatum TaxID=36651 RepID=A0A7T6XSB1_PENDI|nr:Lovastatin diketide synthase LovF [Penicillium digitatum]
MSDGDSRSVPIAIIGMGCRFAGDATSPEKLWKMLEEGRSAWSEIPPSRFNLEGWYHPSQENISTTNVRGGHFLKEDLALFDATFFGLSAETAATMDPQYRLLLESVYESLENAGIPLEQAAGSNTSVFSGAFFHDYQDGHMRDAENLPRFLMTGNGAAMASNRVSHFFDLLGPSITVDTGCSTTLTGLHQACQSLKTGDADMSIVGGSNLLINPDFFITVSTLGMLSPDGKSYSFDSRANGYGRGEGIASIVLKRLDDAIRDGDPIRAVIRETHLNQDGKTETITSPSPKAQERLIRSCYQKAGIDPRSIQYFEAHGTGTPTGDPIEAGAIGSVFGKGRSATDPLFIGSAKTNLGHTEPTSGLASVIKVAMALERRVIPPSINFEKPNKRLLLDKWNLKVPRKCEEWVPGTDGVRRASVNNFGYGGANAHVIMEEWPSQALQNGNGQPNGIGLANGIGNGNGNDHFHENESTNGNGYKLARHRSRIFILSAKDELTCRQMASNLKDYLLCLDLASEEEEKFLNDLSYTLSQRRSRFPWVITCAAESVLGLITSLENERIKPTRSNSDRPRLGFVFTGQGAQWYAMGRELLEVYPVFKDSILEAERYLKEFGADWSLVDELRRDAKTSRVTETSLGMPMCAALQISIVRLLESWGVTPTAVSSHSSGEIAAAYAVGAMSFRSAMAACYSRSEVTSGLTNREGGMIAVGLGAEAVEKYLKKVKNGEAKVACLNSPTSVTVSGDAGAVEELEAMLNEANIFARRLRVRTAFHSHHMQTLYDPYLKGMRAIGVGKEKRTIKPIIYASPTTGTRMSDAAEIANPEHWVKSMLSPVQFIDAFREMALDLSTGQSAIDIAIEVGPHAALSGPIADILLLPEFKDSNISYMSCLIRKSSAVNTMQALAGQLISMGFPVDNNAVNFPLGKTDVSVLHDLPPYPWNHQVRHWSEPRVNRSHRDKQFKHHDLLGSLVKGANTYAPTWRYVIRPAELPWVRDHTVQSNIIYPGAGYICMVIEAARQLSQTNNESISGYRLQDVEIQQALVIPEGSEGVEVQTTIMPVGKKDIGVKGWRKFQIFSAGLDNKWTEHCTGLIHVVFDNVNNDGGRWSWLGPDSEPKPLRGYPKTIDAGQIYADMRSLGICHGPVFQNLEDVQVADKQSVSILSVADVASIMPANYQHEHVLHPTTLDSIFVSAYGALLGSNSHLNSPHVPKKIKTLWVSSKIVSQSGYRYKSYVKVHHTDSKSFQSAISLFDAKEDGDASNEPVLAMDGFVCQSVGAGIPRQLDLHHDDICSTLQWAPDISFMDTAHLKQELIFPVDQEEEGVILDLRRACFHYVHCALGSLTLADVQQLEWHHQRFYAWMKLQVTQALHGELGPGSSKWVEDTTEDKRKLFKSVQASSVNGEVIYRLGPQIAAMLRREVTPLELLMEDKLLYKYYRHALKFDRANVQLSKIIRHIVHKNPRVKILEIGAGTGGTTRSLLDVIGNGKQSGFGPLASEYHFTDVSSGFFVEAQEQFADWNDILIYRKLDIEADPAKQGFELGSYDVIVACQVLHATKRMKTTIENVRRLLKPGGKLLMMESTKNQVDMQLTFGLLPGWWLSEEEERKLSPIMQSPSWDRVLKAAGFSGLDLDVHDCESEETYSFSVIMSTAQPEEPSISHAEPAVIVTGDTSSYQDEVWLRALQESIAAATGGSLPIIESFNSTDVTGKNCIFLGEMHQSLLQKPSPAEFEAIKAFSLKCKNLLWVTRGSAVNCENPKLALSTGFLRSLRQENGGKRYITVDLDPRAPTSREHDASVVATVFASTIGRSIADNDSAQDFEFAERNGTILIPRLVKDFARNSFVSVDNNQDVKSQPELFQQPGRPLRLNIGTTGLLETLSFNHALEDNVDLGSDFIEIEPKAFGLNFRDVMAAMGQLNEQVMGLECSGIIVRIGGVAASKGFAVGDRVFALLNGQYTSRVQVPWTTVCRMPDDLDFETAASIPMIYATAYMSLYDKARLCRDQSILIHAATGGVGQAAIILSQLVGAKVFATAGTSEKRAFITSKYGIPADHVFSSRDASFVPKLMSMTSGRGVDVVLNSLSGQLLQETFNCLAPFGHFVEIGKFDLERNNHLEMMPFTRVASFSSIDLLALVRLGSPHIYRVLASIARLIEQKVISPVGPVTVFPLSDIEKAFRQIQAGKHMGKIVLSVGPQEIVPVVSRKHYARLRSDASYLIAGGVGGIGRSVSRWLLTHGAKNLILVSRSAAAGGRTALFVDELQCSYPGSKVRVIGCDISNKDSFALGLEKIAAELPPIRGVVQAAMVLDDSILENMTINNYNAAIQPKVQGTWNLHQQLGSDLDFFIMLSSLAGVIGNASQSNYTAGGAFQDALARHRVAKGLPGVALDIGAVKDIGYVASNKGVYERLKKMGYRLLAEEEIMSAIESAILDPCPQVMVGINTGGGSSDSILARDSRFSALRFTKPANGSNSASKASSVAGSLAGKLSSAESLHEAAGLVMEALVQKLVDIFMIPAEEVIPAKSMAAFGVDSLVAVELRNMLALKAGSEVSIFDIMQSPSLAVLCDKVASTSGFVVV